MTSLNVSTAYLGSSMLPAVAQADQQLTNLGTEATTGQYADLGLQLGEHSGFELSLRNTDDLLQTYSTLNASLKGQLTATQNALSSIESTANSALSALTAWTPSSSTTVDLAATGDNALQSLITVGNSTYGDDYLFAGINSASAPLAAYNSTSPSNTALTNAFQTTFGCAPNSSAASSIPASSIQSFLAGAFDDQFVGSAWTSNWSSASSTNVTTEIAPGQSLTTSTNANTTGFQDLAQGYAMLSLLGDSSLGTAAKQAVVTAAMSAISKGSSGVTSSAATLGLAQNTLQTTDDDISTQMTLVKTQLGKLDNVNENVVATQLNTLTTEIETAYQVTAQLQKLSLAQYLPA